MPALMQDVWMKIGTSRTLQFGPILNPDGTYANLTGSTAKWGLAKSSIAATPLLTKDSVNNAADVTITTQTALYPDKNNNSIQYWINVQLHPSDWTSVPPSIRPNRWYHECRVTDSLGSVTSIASGHFHLEPSPF